MFDREERERGERGRRQPPTRARGREAAQPPKKRKRSGRGRAAQPPVRSARGEAKRRGGAAAHKRREKRGEGKKRRRRSRRRKREKKRERRAAQPPVSKRSRKQRFLFFCWGLFSCGAFSFFSPPAPSLLVSYVAISLQRLRLALGRLRPFFHCVSRFSRDNNFQFSVFTFQFRFPSRCPFGGLSATLRRNPRIYLETSPIRIHVIITVQATKST